MSAFEANLRPSHEKERQGDDAPRGRGGYGFERRRRFDDFDGQAFGVERFDEIWIARHQKCCRASREGEWNNDTPCGIRKDSQDK